MVSETGMPLCAALFSNKNRKYLKYEKEEGETHKHLRFSGEEMVSRSTKFAIERSMKKFKLVHLRCCHNNKYFVKKSQDDDFIIAGSDQPEEDQSLWACTLFEPIIIEDQDGYGKTVVQLKHLQSESFLSSSNTTQGVYSDCLQLSPLAVDAYSSTQLITVIDWSTLVILPKHIAFKCSSYSKTGNGKYLTSSHPSIRFSADDKTDTRVIHEVVNNPDGTVRVKSGGADEFYWTAHQDGELATEPLTRAENGIYQTFVPIKISSNEIALRCSGTNKFCIINGDTQQLSCRADSILREAKFVVEAAVISRVIFDINYHLEDSRIYDAAPVVLGTSTILNTTQETQVHQSSFRIVEKSSSLWASDSWLNLGVNTTVQVGIRPLITENGIILDPIQFGGEIEWGETVSETREKVVQYSVSVPAMTKGIHSLISKRGTCDVPFSYVVREVYADGKVMVHAMDDGLYTGSNSYGYRTELETRPVWS